jgi:hypothetical protein
MNGATLMKALQRAAGVAALLITAACSGPTIGPKISSATSAPSVTPRETSAPVGTTDQSGALSLGPAPQDIHSVDWPNTALPGTFCGIDGLIPFRAGEAMARSTTYGEVHLFQGMIGAGPVTYGDLNGDGKDEAVVGVECDNNGGTAAGQLVFGAVVVANRGDLRAIGMITPQEQLPNAQHVTLLDDVRVEPGKVVVGEAWYRPSDADCCPSGKAVTTWTLSSGTLRAQPPVVTK